VTIQQEDQYIHELLPEIAAQPTGYDMHDYEFPLYVEIVLPIVKRLESENLAVAQDKNHPYFLTITHKGRQIAGAPSGYLGFLQREKHRLRIEDKRAARSASGSWLSGIAGILGAILAAYSLFSSSQDTKHLNTKLEAQDKRIQNLEMQIQRHKQYHKDSR
jgi:hypothetical protein